MNNSTILKNAVAGITLLAITASAIETIDHSTDGYTAKAVNVDSSDLDLLTRSGLRILYGRVQDASLLACDPTGQSRLLPLYDQPESGNCYIDTFNAALVEIDSPQLNFLHDDLKRAPVFVY